MYTRHIITHLQKLVIRHRILFLSGVRVYGSTHDTFSILGVCSKEHSSSTIIQVRVKSPIFSKEPLSLLKCTQMASVAHLSCLSLEIFGCFCERQKILIEQMDLQLSGGANANTQANLPFIRLSLRRVNERRRQRKKVKQMLICLERQSTPPRVHVAQQFYKYRFKALPFFFPQILKMT